MNSYLQEAKRIPYTNGSGSTLNPTDVVVFGTGSARRLGVVVARILAGAIGAISVAEVHTLNALSTDVGSAGDRVYYDTVNARITTTKSASSTTVVYAGILIADKTNGQTTASVWLNAPFVGRLAYNQVAGSTVVTNSTVEALFDQSYVLPANTLKVGDKIRIRAQAIAPATNSTDTLNLKLYIGGLAGTAIAVTGAVDVANNDIGIFTAELEVRAIGATGSIIASGYHSLGTSGTVTAKAFNLGATAIDTTAAQTIGVSATWSVANVGNQARLDILSIEHVG